MFCIKCGNKLEGPFCDNCGAPAPNTSSQPPESPAAPSANPYAPPAPPVPGVNPYAPPPPYQGAVNDTVQPYSPYSPSPVQTQYRMPGDITEEQKKRNRKLLTIIIAVVAVVVVSFTVLFVSLLSGGSKTPTTIESDENGGTSGETGGTADIPGFTGGVADDGSDLMYEISSDALQGETEAWSGVLTPGHWVAGVDFPAGYYTFYAVEGFGNVMSNNYGEGWVNEILGVDWEDYEDSYTTEVYLSKGTMLTLLGVTVRLEADVADVKNLEPRTAGGLGTETTLEGGSTYTAGSDFPAGIYDVSVVTGSGSVYTGNDNAYGGMSEYMSEDSTYGESFFRGVVLAAGTTIEVDAGVTIKLVPTTTALQ